ncbi:MAG TPA: SRPBCC family protein [Gemmataceae bacterium]|nr:SRPBCC family protein [Gemmataceae bacterium]
MFLNVIIGIGIALVVLIAAVLIIAATKPDTFRIERSASIKAPPERIFALINDFHNWGAWSPWEKLDPNLKRTFSGEPSGTGAIYEWEGNKKVGQGRMEIKESSPSRKITIQLDFIKPFQANNTAEFTFEPSGDSTNVNWAMLGGQPFMFKVMKVFMNMDKLVGKDFETGLANLKAQTEK